MDIERICEACAGIKDKCYGMCNDMWPDGRLREFEIMRLVMAGLVTIGLL